MFFDPLWLYRSKLKSRETLRHTTAALSTIHKGQLRCLLLLLQCCTFGCIFLIPFQLFPLSTAPSDAVLQVCQPNDCKVCYRSFWRECRCMCMCCSGTAVNEWACVYTGLCICVSKQCGDGGSVSSVRTAVHTAGVQLPSRGWAGPCWRGQGTEGAALLIPQDGVLVVKLQVLHRSTTGLLSTTVPVFHNFKGLLNFSVPKGQT